MSLIPPSQLESLTTRREDQWFERKGSKTQPRAIAEAMVGMANAEGGTIVVGISDAGIVGVFDLKPSTGCRRRRSTLRTRPSVIASPSSPPPQRAERLWRSHSLSWNPVMSYTG